MLDWLKTTIRAFLGLDNLASFDLWKAHEKFDRERHKEIMAAFSELTKRLEAAHTFEPLKPAPKSYDWEQVQAMQLQRAIDEDANRKDSDA